LGERFDCVDLAKKLLSLFPSLERAFVAHSNSLSSDQRPTYTARQSIIGSLGALFCYAAGCDGPINTDEAQYLKEVLAILGASEPTANVADLAATQQTHHDTHWFQSSRAINDSHLDSLIKLPLRYDNEMGTSV